MAGSGVSPSLSSPTPPQMELIKHPIGLIRSWWYSCRAVPSPPGTAAERRGPVAPLLLLLFFGSGCAALIYEIVWFQLLEFVIGSTAISLAVLLGTFMGGMCLGSLALPRLVSPRHHPLRICAFARDLLPFVCETGPVDVLFRGL